MSLYLVVFFLSYIKAQGHQWGLDSTGLDESALETMKHEMLVV